MISEALEEAGLDREHVRTLRRQVLQGMILMCQWQLERMSEHDGDSEAPDAKPKGPRMKRVDLG